jgi:type IV secretion system protein VirB8
LNRPISAAEFERQAYYTEAASWADEAAAASKRSSRVAWRVAGAACAVALLEALALATLTPLKTTEPYVVTVDRQTGYVQTTQGLLPGGTLTQNQAVTQAALVQYVLAREGFDATDLKENYRRVQLWSAPEAKAAYLKWMSVQNPASPLKVNAPTATVAVSVKSVSMLDGATALVRFETETRAAGQTSGMVQPYTAAISFRWSGEPLKAEDRFVNPLGFQVTRYRRDAETVAPVMPAANPLLGARP